MKQSAISKHHLFVIGCALLLFGATFFICHRLFATQSISCSFDKNVSCDARREIVDFVADLEHKTSITPSQIIQELHQNFKWIDSVAVRRAPRNTAEVTIRVRPAFCILNADHVLNDKGRVIAKNVYDSHALSELQTIYVPKNRVQDTKVAQIMRSYLAQIPDSIFAQYDVHYLDDKKVVLKDREQKNFSIVCDPHDAFKSELLTQCTKIKAQVRNGHTKRRSKEWVADLRFAHQIVLSNNTGGVNNGKEAC